MTAKNTTGTSAGSSRCNYDAGIQDKAGSLASTSAEAPRHTPELLAQRDELLAALKATLLSPWFSSVHDRDPKVSAMARAAIARCARAEKGQL